VEASKANPLGKSWSELSFDQRRSVVAEKEQELARLKHNILYEDPKREHPFSLAQGDHVNQGQVAGGAALSQAVAPKDPRDAEVRYAGIIREALDAFLGLPTGVNSQQVARWFEAYQTAWMQDRKRVTIHE
jgi:hypothetical protein